MRDVAEIPVSHKQTALVQIGQVQDEAVREIRKEVINLQVRPEKLQLTLVPLAQAPRALVKSQLQRSARHASVIEPEVVKKTLKLLR